MEKTKTNIQNSTFLFVKSCGEQLDCPDHLTMNLMTVLNRTKNACSTRVFSHQLHQRTVLNSGVPQLKKLNKDDSETIAQRMRPLVGGQNVSLAEAVRSQHGTDP